MSLFELIRLVYTSGSLLELPWLWYVYVAGMLLGVAHIPSVLLQRRERPAAALAWILCLIELPFLGVLAWWGIGRTRITRRRRRLVRAREEMIDSLGVLLREGHEGALPDSPQELEHVRDLQKARAFLLDDEGLFPATGSNHTRVLVGGQQTYAALHEAIKGAREHIHMQFYIWQNDEVGRQMRDLLVERAREGVEVRVLYDAIGGAPVAGKFMQPLIDAGGQVASFLPLRFFERSLRINFRNHRKIVIVDAELGFSGGLNVGEEYNAWMDLFFRFEGPVVYQLQEVFAEDWYFAACEDLASERYFPLNERPDSWDVCDEGDVEAAARVISSGPDLQRRTLQKMFFLAITSARERIYIATPYFVPDQAIKTALQSAALRGVDVRVMVPGTNDVPVAQMASRAFYEELLEQGVRIYEYDRGQILHAKMLLFDQEWSIVGSANMDIRSFRLNFETNTALYSKELNAQLAQWFMDCLRRSEEIDAERFAQRGLGRRYLEALARLGSPLL